MYNQWGVWVEKPQTFDITWLLVLLVVALLLAVVFIALSVADLSKCTDEERKSLIDAFKTTVSVIKPEWGERINQLEQQKLDNRLKLQDVRKEAAHADLMEIRAEQERRELNEESDRRSEREYEFD